MYLIEHLILWNEWDRVIKIETIEQQPGLIKSLVDGIATISNIENILMVDKILEKSKKLISKHKWIII